MYELFWVRVKNQLKAHKISQEKFADYIGVSPGTLKGWIHYDRIPDAFCTSDMADALGVTMEYLVRGEDSGREDLRMQQVYERKNASDKIKSLITMLESEAARI